jgi:6-phosphogluconolactonase
METFLKNKKKLFFSDKEKMATYAADLFEEKAKEAIFKTNRFSVAVSGGNTPNLFFQKLKKKNLPWDKVHIFFADERFVPLDDENSNYNLLSKSLLSGVETNVYPFFIEGKGIKTCAAIYKKKILDFFGKKDICFDLVFLGMGVDGHTASLFSQEDISKKDILLTIERKEVKFPRMSLSLNVINNAKNIVFLVSGEDKSLIVKQVLEKKSSILPASMVHSKNGFTYYLLDQKDLK